VYSLLSLQAVYKKLLIHAKAPAMYGDLYTCWIFAHAKSFTRMREPRHGYEVPVHARSFEIRESRTWDSYTREDFRIIARLGTRRNYETTKQRSLVSKRLDEIRQTMSYRNCILITDFMMADESYRLILSRVVKLVTCLVSLLRALTEILIILCSIFIDIFLLAVIFMLD